MRSNNNQDRSAGPWAWLLGGASLAVALAPSFPLLDAKLLAAGLALCLALLLAGLSALGKGQLRLALPDTGLMLGLLAFWGSGALAARASILPQAGDQLLARTLLLGFFGMLASAMGLRLAESRRVLKLILLAAALNAAYALLQRLGLDPVESTRQAGSASRAMAFFGNPDFLAAFLCLAWPLALAVGWGLQPVLVLLSILALALLATASRAGLLAAHLQALLLLIWAWRRPPVSLSGHKYNQMSAEHYGRYVWFDGSSTSGYKVPLGSTANIQNLGYLYVLNYIGDGSIMYCPGYNAKPIASELAAQYYQPLLTTTVGSVRSSYVWNPGPCLAAMEPTTGSMRS